MGFPRQEYWSGLPFPPPGDLLNPGIEPASQMFPILRVDSLPTTHPGSLRANQNYRKVLVLFSSQHPTDPGVVSLYSDHHFLSVCLVPSCLWSPLPPHLACGIKEGGSHIYLRASFTWRSYLLTSVQLNLWNWRGGILRHLLATYLQSPVWILYGLD